MDEVRDVNALLTCFDEAVAGRHHGDPGVPEEVAAVLSLLLGDSARDVTVLRPASASVGTFVGRIDQRVVKVHPEGTRLDALTARLRAATRLRDAFLAPSGEAREVAGRVVTFWPYGHPVAPDAPELVPWAAAGVLLAQVHRAPGGLGRAQVGWQAPGLMEPIRRQPRTSITGELFGRAPGVSGPESGGPAPDAPALDVPPPAFPAQAFPAQDFPAQGFPAQGFPAQGIPAQGFPASVADSLDRLAATTDDQLAGAGVPNWARAAVTDAAHTLPAWTVDRAARPQPGRPTTLVHGDFHLGQLVLTAVHVGRDRPIPANVPAGSAPEDTARDPATQVAWRLIDIDSLGIGDPAWDLARPAMWWLAGVVAPEDWGRFLDAYLDSGGRGVPPQPWPALEPFARAAAIQGGASVLARAGQRGAALDDVDEALVDACRRIAQG